MWSTVLVANRGEIAVRIIRTLRALGIRSVAVYSDADVDARHVRAADVAIRLGPGPARDSYLSIERVVGAALMTGAEALHPGYGFLAENPALAEACESAGIVFVGPPAAAIRAMGDKIEAKRTVAAAGVRVVPGFDGSGLTDEEIGDAAMSLGFPVLLKPTAGGGGKGMRLVREASAMRTELPAARREASGSFGDDTLLIERYVAQPRHIEIQVAADAHGDIIHFGERECSLQRRYQKIIEEAPSPFVSPALRAEMARQAIIAARACSYRNIGTVEFVVSGMSSEEFFFMEMNTRLQVEHAVTELVYGIDLVELQLRLAAGQHMPYAEDALRPIGHAVEARVYAEDPARGFLPTGGTVLVLREPSGPGIRVDSGIGAGTVVGADYDPMLSKVIAHGPDRQTAIRRLDAALGEYAILGVTTNLEHLRSLLADPDVVAGQLDTTLVERRHMDARPEPPDPAALAAVALLALSAPDASSPWAGTSGWRHGGTAPTTMLLAAGDDPPTLVTVQAFGDDWQVSVAGDASLPAAIEHSEARLLCHYGGRTTSFDLYQEADLTWIANGGRVWVIRRCRAASLRPSSDLRGAGPILSPMPGLLVAVHVAVGDHVDAGQAVATVEAMKMEHTLTTVGAGRVVAIHASPGQQVQMNEPVVTVEPGPELGRA